MTTDFNGFHPKTNPGILFESNSKTGDKKRLPTKYEVLRLTLKLVEKHKMLYVPLRFNRYKTDALLDIGAVQNSISESELQKVTTAQPESLQREMPVPEIKIQFVNGNLVKVTNNRYYDFF